MLYSFQTGWTVQEKIFKEEENKLKARITDLLEQNRMLHEEMEAVCIGIGYWKQILKCVEILETNAKMCWKRPRFVYNNVFTSG